MTKEDRDKMLTYLTEQINTDITDCRLRIAKENGIIDGLQMAAAQIACYVREQAESEDRQMNDEKNIKDMQKAIRLYSDGEIVEALDALEIVVCRLREFIEESEEQP